MPGTPAPGAVHTQTWVDQWYTWAYAVLNGIGAPTSQTNINTLWNWSIKESGANNPLSNGNIQNNPLNTTQPAPGSTKGNSAGVQSYPDVSTGAAATVQTLLNGYYPQIVTALRNSTPTSQWGSNASIVSELGTWGSGANWLGWNNQAPNASTNFQSVTTTGSGVGSTSSGNPITDAVNAALSPIGTAITGATNTLVEKATYGVLLAIGAGLMLLGFVILILPMIGKGASLAANATPQGRAVNTAVGVATAAKKPAPAASTPQDGASRPAAAAAAPAPSTPRQTRAERSAEIERGVSEGRSLGQLRRRR